ncbi:hypothetical protein FEM48_Zijuj04G0144800 [Ziziphus jujuba var. spinosa]|uniref:7-deoxyloganetin glucosyltransferase-like n=1 Tax=Ziziphus jujuba var. spinosa TaxID=714518 RepID=A0A978VKE7_ZIZJJ|nr:hypothetical protein FEM48_Zijuj04G0144800 [Ziziphus jujuba var. spinosa]
MGSKAIADQKPHVVCVPSPGQSHIKAMLKLAQLLHHRGFHVTFVNTEFIHNRFLRTQGPNSLDGLPDFQFETIPDGLPPPSDADHAATRDTSSNIEAIRKNFLTPFSDLLRKLNESSISNTCPPVTRIVSDGFMPFTITAGEELGIPVVLFFTIPACAFMAIKQLHALMEKFNLPPRKDDERSETNEILDTVIDWIPGMKDMRLRDLPSFCSFRNVHDHVLFDFNMEVADRANKASAVIVQTFYDLEKHVLDALSIMHPHVFAIGPLQLLLNRIPEHPMKLFTSNLWKEDSECLQWLDSKPPNSVVYVNFGSVTVITPKQLVEFGMGLAESKHFFLWVIRPNLVVAHEATAPHGSSSIDLDNLVRLLLL